jgi:hypothetical protein
MPSVTDGHSLFAQSSTPSTMAVDYSQVANPCGLAVSGAYLVSLCVHLAGKPEDGVRDSLSTGSHFGKRCTVHDKCIRTSCLLATASPRGGKQAQAVQSLRWFRREFTLHFPYPLPQQPPRVLLVGLGTTCADLVCLRTGCLTTASNARITPDARVVEVTPFQTWFGGKQDTESGCALVISVSCCKTNCNKM